MCSNELIKTQSDVMADRFVQFQFLYIQAVKRKSSDVSLFYQIKWVVLFILV
jgi:hypothetical protein